MTFTQDNTQGYTDEQLAQLNREWDAIVDHEEITVDSPQWKHRRERLLRDYDQGVCSCCGGQGWISTNGANDVDCPACQMKSYRVYEAVRNAVGGIDGVGGGWTMIEAETAEEAARLYWDDHRRSSDADVIVATDDDGDSYHAVADDLDASLLCHACGDIVIPEEDRVGCGSHCPECNATI